jgi:cyclophilin family peptidyl-prolyl cis-trans isomerase
MKTDSTRRLLWATAAFALALGACGGSAPDEDTAMNESGPIAHNLFPLPGMEDSIPLLTEKQTVILNTTTGKITLEIYPEAAPNAARRFIRLVQSGYYDNTPISRVVDGFVAQFGINWREPHSTWRDSNFDDDPTLFALARGTLAFAKAGPNTNSTQVFINFADNSRLAAQTFTVFGNVIAGMNFVDDFERVGDAGGGLDQTSLWAYGEDYLDQLATKPTMIESAYVVR